MPDSQGVTMRKAEKPFYISVKVGRELYKLILQEANAREIDLIDVVVQATAKHFNKPELGYVPRAKRGPKAGKALAG